jgi:VanZ family protein
VTKSRFNLVLSVWFGYLFFVVYGSLVPLEFKSIPIDQAWSAFQQIPFLVLGVESRADWIANGVLYIPVGFLTAHLLIQKFSSTWRVPLFFVCAIFSFVLAFSVEFTQLFFPPRTVSLNDLLAECIGSLIGLMLAARYSNWFQSLVHAIFSDPRRWTLRLLEAYLLAYIAFSLFPYDLLLSGSELAQKLQGDNWGLMLAGDAQGKLLPALKLLSEIALTVPFGLFLGYQAPAKSAKAKQAIWWGLLLGGFIEMAQLFTASGVTQGLSVLTRIVGVWCGLAMWNQRTSWSPERLASLIKRYALPLGALYFLALLQVNGWFSHGWHGQAYAAAQLEELHFLPFYYHYYTTEAKALFSLASVCLMYLPIALLTWAKRGSPVFAVIFTLLVAGMVETGKLFLQDLHPDPTNILLGAFASWCVVHLAMMLSKAASALPDINIGVGQITQKLNPALQSGWRPRLATDKTRRSCLANFLVFPSLAFAAYWAATFPTQPVLLILFLCICAAIIWVRPVFIVAIIPAALPVLDLAPWSGRFFLDEFDLLIMVSLAIGYVRVHPVQDKKRSADRLFALVSSLLVISFTISAIRGLTPWQMPDANAFTNYFSPFNALRVSKGALWALLSLELLRRMAAAQMDIKSPLVTGMVTGLALTVVSIFWERLTFSGLTDFSSDYRVTGPFSSMHTGGAYIECFLVTAIPFLVLLILKTKNWIIRLFGILLSLATTYALMVTFSRNGYMAFGVALSIILFFSLFKSGQRQRRSMLVVLITGAMLAVAIPVFTGQFAQDRIASLDKDYLVRQHHWEDALSIRRTDWLTSLFGMGLGRYPEMRYLMAGEDTRSATYQLVSENKETFLRLTAGGAIHLEQIVPVEPQQKYLLQFDVRSSKPDAEITIAICEKWLLASANCVWSSVSSGQQTGVWRHFNIQIRTDQLSDGPWYSQRPIKLALYNGVSKTIIDVDNVRLEDFFGNNLLRNGDFSNQMDNWFFSADSHLEWHVKSLPIAVLFELGWLGLIAICVFSILAIKRASSRALQGDMAAAAALASFSGFLVVGLFDTLIDAPRFLFLLLMLGGVCGFRGSTGHKSTHRNGQRV